MTIHIANPTLFARLHASADQIADFCQRWHIAEFALFGSILRDDFDPDNSDIDILVAFQPEAKRGLTEWLDMQDELEATFRRKVDLVSKVAIQESPNWIRKRNILESAQVLYDG